MEQSVGVKGGGENIKNLSYTVFRYEICGKSEEAASHDVKRIARSAAEINVKKLPNPAPARQGARKTAEDNDTSTQPPTDLRGSP